MRLQLVQPLPAFTARCIGCGERRDSRDLWADLDGPAFKAYYCHGCAIERGALNTQPEA